MADTSTEAESDPYAHVRRHKWVLIGAAILVLFIIGTITSIGGDDTEPVAGETVTVPDVDGMNLPDAIDALDDVGLASEASDANEDRSIIRRSNWHVVDQDPAAGQEVGSGSTVALGVANVRDDDEDEAAEPVEVAVPDVTGMNLAEADRELRAAGLIAGPQDVHPDHDSRTVLKFDNWYAMAQCAEPDEVVAEGDLVVVAVVKVDELTPEMRAAGERMQDELTC